MSSENKLESEKAHLDNLLQQTRAWFFAIVATIVVSLIITICATLVDERKLWSIPIALCIGGLFWILENFEGKLGSRIDGKPLHGWRSSHVALIVAGVAFFACLPTLNIYFLTDDFALLHAFHQLTVAQFVRLLQMDTRVFVSGDARQEFRPIYSLYYAFGYHAWGVRTWGYHLFEMSLHASAAVLVFSIVNVLAPGNLRRAASAAFLFAVQPPIAQATSLVVGGVAESLPAIFYLTALLFFIQYRGRRLLSCLAISITAFILCLLTKESAVTLPLMLFAYDIIRFIANGAIRVLREGNRARRFWRELFFPYALYGSLLIFYLEWRRKVLSSFLREPNWGSQAHSEIVSPVSYETHVIHFARHVWQLQRFNFDCLFPYSAIGLGMVLGLFGIWGVLFLLRRKEIDISVFLLFAFGFVWYLIANLPYVIEGQVPYHLYLPAIGMCIAVASVVFPSPLGIKRSAQLSRIFATFVLVMLAAIQMWKDDSQYKRLGNLSEQMTSQLALRLKNVPSGGLTVLWPGSSELVSTGWGEGIEPFSVQPPFTSDDLSKRTSIISHPDLSCCGDAFWWQNTQPILDETNRSSDGETTLSLLTWNDQTSTFDLSTRTMPDKLFVVSVSTALGAAPLSLESVDHEQGIRLVKSLVGLVQNSPVQLQQ